MVASNITLTLIGGPTALIEIGSSRRLTDPTFDPPRGYQKGPVHYDKISGPALSVEEIGVVDAVAARAASTRPSPRARAARMPVR